MHVQAHIFTCTERAADTAERQSHLLGSEPEALGHLFAVVVEPLRGHDEVDAALGVGNGEPGLRSHEGLVLHTDLVGALHRDWSVQAHVAAADHEISEHVAVGVDRGRVDR